MFFRVRRSALERKQAFRPAKTPPPLEGARGRGVDCTKHDWAANDARASTIASFRAVSTYGKRQNRFGIEPKVRSSQVSQAAHLTWFLHATLLRIFKINTWRGSVKRCSFRVQSNFFFREHTHTHTSLNNTIIIYCYIYLC